MQHADVEIPKAQSAVLTHAAEAVVPVVAAPGVEGHRCDPRLVAVAAGHDGRIEDRPDRDEVVLATGENILAIRRPANGDEAAVVRVEEVKEPETKG